MAISQVTIKRVLAAIAGSASALAVIWLVLDWLQDQSATDRADAHVREILSMLQLKALPNFRQQVDRVRIFINDNSVHEIDAAFRANQGRPDAFLAGLLAYAKGRAAEPIHMECATRTATMERILNALNYETRIIAIFDSHTNLRSHSFLEVMNPETKRWEAQDPDYDIYWRSKISGERISLADSAQRIEDIEPCNRRECGWEASKQGTKAKKLIEYLDIVSVTAKKRTLRFALYTSRAELGQIYAKGGRQGSFCEVEAKRCKHGFHDIREYSTYEPGLPR